MLLPNESQSICLSFRKHSLSSKTLRTLAALDVLIRKASATTIGKAYTSVKYPLGSLMCLSTSQGFNTPLLYTARMAARNVGAITSKSSTNSISLIHTLAASDGTATLPFPSSVMTSHFIHLPLLCCRMTCSTGCRMPSGRCPAFAWLSSHRFGSS